MGLRIGLVGSGAIGTYYGAKLAHAGSDVHFLMRGDLGDVRNNGIFVRGEGENFRVAKINCYNSTKEIGRSAQTRTHAVAAEFSRANVQCTVTDNIALERWRKLIWNIPFNGLSILAGGIDTAAIVADDN